MTTTTTYQDIDWDRLWKNSRRNKSWCSKGAGDWNKKARSFQERNSRSPYVDLFLEKIDPFLDSSTTILDVGAGPGTLALPLAGHGASVTAIDYSPTMLEILEQSGADQGHKNITTICAAWEDDWQSHGVVPHDIAIASRSMAVDDLRSALTRLNRYAKKYVFISDRISPTPFEPAAFEAIGRDFNSGPDYIYTLNILYTMGIHPHVDIIKLDQDTRFDSIDTAMKSYRWMLKELTTKEEELLRSYLERQIVARDGDSVTIRRSRPPRWALIWWPTNPKIS
ncbi:MAG: class I SAM-dependent methyltransferase [Thermodesulfobacteriota bacterium]